MLKTRLYKPVIKPHYVTRKKILDYLEQREDNSLNLVVAPAGYGKSVTISQWLERKGAKYGWISLDSDCNDLRIFLDYLVTCIQISFPDTLSKIQELCNAVDLPSVKIISYLFINEITELEEDFALVLDDYHLIDNQQFHDLVNEILKYHPEKLSLFIISRRDPPLKLSSLRAYDRVNEIRMAELSFDVNEVVDLSNKISAKQINYYSASELVDLTEGWIIGIRLAIQSYEQGHDLKLVISNKGSEKQTITMFMVDEILQPLTPFVREFFFKASILSRFCRDLLLEICLSEETAVYTSHDTGDITFTDITTNNLFIIPLDSDKVWFRFHHLFGEILKKQLEKRYGPDQISTLHWKASRWFERNGYFDEAIQHALNAGDLEFAHQIIETQLKDLFDHEKLSQMDRWLKMFPAEAMDNYLAPNLIDAYLSDLHHDHISMERALNKAFKILAGLSPEHPHNKTKFGYYFSLQSILFFKTGRIEESSFSSTHSLELLDTENSFLKDMALLYNVFALFSAGKQAEASKKVMHYRTSIQSGDLPGLERNSIIDSYISFLSGDLPRIYNTLHPFIEFYEWKSGQTTKDAVYYYLGFVNYQWNNIDKAVYYFDDIWDRRFSGMPRWILHHLFIKALSLHSKGEKEALNDLLDKAHNYVNALGLPFLDPFLASMEVEIALIENDLKRVEQYHKKADYYHYMPFTYYFAPQLTSVKVKIKEGGTENFLKAQAELSDITEYLRTTRNTTLLLQALTLRALLLKLMGNTEEALTSLSEAIHLAKPGSFIRIFVDMGEEIRDLMVLQKDKNPDDPYINKILEAFYYEHTSGTYLSNHENTTGKYPSILNTDNLSAKEIEILKLAALGLQNKQIGDKLFLSPNSIKKYLYYIFKKLKVKNRANAIERAKQMNLI